VWSVYRYFCVIAKYLYFQKDHENEYIAIYNQKLIDAKADLRQLIEEIKKQGIDPSFVLIEYIPKAWDYYFILDFRLGDVVRP